MPPSPGHDTPWNFELNSCEFSQLSGNFESQFPMHHIDGALSISSTNFAWGQKSEEGLIPKVPRHVHPSFINIIKACNRYYQGFVSGARIEVLGAGWSAGSWYDAALPAYFPCNPLQNKNQQGHEERCRGIAPSESVFIRTGRRYPYFEDHSIAKWCMSMADQVFF